MKPILIAAMLLQAAANPPQDRPPVLTQPDWLARPNASDLMRYFPKAAETAHIGGRAVLHCTLDAAGKLTDCTATEDPPGYGFAEAAIAMASLFRMRPQTKDGQPVGGGKINIPIRFDRPGDVMPSAVLAARCYGYAAAAAEREPASVELQAALVAWRTILNIRSLPERQRPSEFEQLLVSLRKSGAEKLDQPSSKSERDECSAVLHQNPSMLSELEAMARQ
ncbi:MAG: energy transducer TonB [Phenylobacterium sp.]